MEELLPYLRRLPGLQHGVIHGKAPYGLPLNFTLLPQKLREAGYVTHMVGKWHLGFFKWAYTPTYRGFDTFYGHYTGVEDHFTHEHEDILDLRNNKEPVRDMNGTYSAHLFSKQAEKIVSDHDSSKPLFLYLPFQNVHSPVQAPQSYVDRYKFIEDIKRRTYAGMVDAVDEAIGNVTRAFKQKGLWENTLMVFSTDNGGIPGGGGYDWPLRGHKGTLWEGGVRGVAFVHGSLLKRSGVICKELLHVTDWYPTLLNLAGNFGSQPSDTGPLVSATTTTPTAYSYAPSGNAAASGADKYAALSQLDNLFGSSDSSTSSSAFGSNSNTSLGISSGPNPFASTTPSSVRSAFGNSQPQPPASMSSGFGQTPPQQQTGMGSGFGQSPPQQQTGLGGGFGQSAPQQQSSMGGGFGQTQQSLNPFQGFGEGGSGAAFGQMNGPGSSMAPSTSLGVSGSTSGFGNFASASPGQAGGMSGGGMFGSQPQSQPQQQSMGCSAMSAAPTSMGMAPVSSPQNLSFGGAGMTAMAATQFGKAAVVPQQQAGFGGQAQGGFGGGQMGGGNFGGQFGGGNYGGQMGQGFGATQGMGSQQGGFAAQQSAARFGAQQGVQQPGGFVNQQMGGFGGQGMGGGMMAGQSMQPQQQQQFGGWQQGQPNPFMGGAQQQMQRQSTNPFM